MVRRPFTALALVAIGLSLSAAPLPAPAAEPGWFREHLDFLARGSGRWIADNAAWRSDEEPFDAYATEWEWGLGKKSLKGRLFGLSAGAEQGTFWEFRLYWDPAEDRAVALQFGADGTVGTGTLTERGDDATASEQTFTSPDGSARRVRHETTVEGERHTTQSYERVGDGWRANRTYVWERE